MKEARRVTYLDFQSILLIVAIVIAFGTLQGFVFGVINNCILLYCDWRDGVDIDWGSGIGFIIAGPIAWLFTIFEVILLYWK